MKYLIILFILYFTNIYANGEFQNISWNYDYEKALKEAKEKKKGLLLLLIKEKSRQSKHLLSSTLKENSIITKINKNYISVIATFEHKNSYPIELFYTQTFPTIFFINPLDESYLTTPLSGNISSEILLKTLNSISLSKHIFDQ